MGASDKMFYARFVPTASDMELALRVAGKAVPTTFTVSESTQLALDVESLSLPKISVKGLPSGMKFTAKAIYKKGSKTEIETPTNTIYGAPTKPGMYKVSVSISNTSVKKAIVKEFTIEVPNLTAANGYFVDEPANNVGQTYVLSVGISNIDDFLPSLKLDSPTAKLAVSGLPTGLKYDAKTGKITGVATKAGIYTVTLTVTDGKEKYVSTITIEVEALPDWVVGTFNGFAVAKGVRAWWECPMMLNATIGSTGKITIKNTGPGGGASARSGQLTAIESPDKYVFEFDWKTGREGYSGYNDFTCTGFIERVDVGNGVSAGRLSYSEFGVCDEDYDPTEAAGEAMQDVYGRKELSVQLPDFGKTNSRKESVDTYLCDVSGREGPYVAGDIILKFGKKGAVTAVWTNARSSKSVTCSTCLQVNAIDAEKGVEASVWTLFPDSVLGTNIGFRFDVTIPLQSGVSAEDVAVELADTAYDR
jgi:PKD repeat protein